MPRWVALLRGVSPMNAKMPQLKACFEEAGFGAVKTLLSSGNVVFDARSTSEAATARKVEAAMAAGLPQTFPLILRKQSELQALLAADAFSEFKLPAGSKRVVTFLRDPPKAKLDLPKEFDGARILAVRGREIYTAYVPTGKGAAFMVLIEKTFGKEGTTTRTWETVGKCAVG
jgi:uncharacterized protein (DUF1697 family)